MILPNDKVYHARSRRYGRVISVGLDGGLAEVEYQSGTEDTRLNELERYSDVYAGGPVVNTMVYVAHPLGPDGDQRKANQASAALWCAALAKHYRVSVCADWITLSSVWPETPELRALGISLDLIQVGRCDEIWLCGPKVSDGMSIEGASAVVHAKPVRSFIGMSPDNLPKALPEMLDFRHVVQSHLKTLA